MPVYYHNAQIFIYTDANIKGIGVILNKRRRTMHKNQKPTFQKN